MAKGVYLCAVHLLSAKIPSEWVFISLFLMLSMAACRFTGSKESSEKEASAESRSEYYKNLTDSIEKYPDSADLYFERGQISFQTEDYDSARKDIDKALELKPFAVSYLTVLGQMYLDQGFPDSAHHYFKRALVIEPQNKIARLQTAFILFNQDQPDSALAETRILLEQSPELPEALGLQSQIFEKLGKKKEAFEYAEKAYHVAPGSYDVLMRMGDLLLDRKDEKALRFYEEAKMLSPRSAEPYYCIGLVKEMQGNVSGAKKAFDEAITKDPHFIPTYLHLGEAYKRSGDWDKAREIFNLAIQMSPTSSEGYYERGLANENLKEQQAARADYEQALIFDEHNQKAKDALSRLEEK